MLAFEGRRGGRPTWLAHRACAFAVALLVSCSGSCESCETDKGLDVLVVADPASTIPVGGAAVSLVGTTVAGVTGTGGHVLFPDVAPGIVKVRVNAAGYCIAQEDVTVLPDVRTFVTITIVLCSTPDQVKVDGNGSAGDAVVLVDALVQSGGGPECRNDLVLRDPSVAVIPGNAVPTTADSPACASSATIFTSDNGARREAPGAGLAWTAAMGDEVRVTLPATRTPVPLRFWISVPSSKTAIAESLIRDTHLKDLEELFRSRRTGLIAAYTLADGTEAITTVEKAADGNSAKESLLRNTIGKSCLNARGIALKSEIFDPEALNVYYIDGLTEPVPNGDFRQGWYCYQQGAGNILFVEALDQDKPHMLSHEVGHALGLIEPWDGHAEVAMGYLADVDNVMEYGLSETKVLTLGQVFRMNFSGYSWLNMPRPSGSSAREVWLSSLGLPSETPVSCPCETRNPSPLPCPRSLLDLDREPPANTDIGAACKAEGLDPTYAIGCGNSLEVSVTFRDENGTAGAGARTSWVSDNPDVATVTLEESDVLKAVATIHAEKTGTARVTVYAGGRTATQSTVVTVTGACPP